MTYHAMDHLPDDPAELVRIGPCPNCGTPPVDIRAEHLRQILHIARNMYPTSNHISIDVDKFAEVGVDWTAPEVPLKAILMVATSAQNHQPAL